jgi:hypothetical protein
MRLADYSLTKAKIIKISIYERIFIHWRALHGNVLQSHLRVILKIRKMESACGAIHHRFVHRLRPGRRQHLLRMSK